MKLNLTGQSTFADNSAVLISASEVLAFALGTLRNYDGHGDGQGDGHGDGYGDSHGNGNVKKH